MSPQIEAALIAAIVSLVSLGGTIVVALRGFQATRQATADSLEAQREQLERTLAEQRARTLNDRFASAAEQLGFDKPAAVRLAGVYAMAGLADDWEDNRQTCIDVLCGYLRMPYAPDPGDGAARLGFLADREVRHTAIRVIAAHLRDDARVSWCGKDFDFTGVIFDGGNFLQARFSGGQVDFSEAKFSGATVSFGGAEFSGATVSFRDAEFSGSRVDFSAAEFSGGTVSFGGAEFSGGRVDFGGAEFSGGQVDFSDAEFSGATVSFGSVEFSGATVSFGGAEFSGSTVGFGSAEFSGGQVNFRFAEFSGGQVNFGFAEFSSATVSFGSAEFSGGTVNFERTKVWLHPPQFDWAVGAVPPPGVKLPSKAESSAGGDNV